MYISYLPKFLHSAIELYHKSAFSRFSGQNAGKYSGVKYNSAYLIRHAKNPDVLCAILPFVLMTKSTGSMLPKSRYLLNSSSVMLAISLGGSFLIPLIISSLPP